MAVYRVLVVRTAIGVNVAVVPAKVRVPDTGVAPGPVKVNVAVSIVAGFMAWLKVPETAVLTAAAEPPLTGTVETIDGDGTVAKAHT